MNCHDIRNSFFSFFIQQKHTKVDSSSLIPADDPTLLFTNAGMNQFKDVFLGSEQRPYGRAVSIQKCIRAGGKHNDLDNVGFTKRHLTFFEMMGNFSFGDYFKKEAIIFAWDFLTKEVKLPKERLYASVFRDDEHAYELWHTVIGLPQERIIRLGEKDNFWQMGDTGPCGPCSEIYIDRGTSHGCNAPDCAPGCSCDRFLEIWNLVFMQFDRQPDGTLLALKKTGVDTGMGLERLCAVIENKDSVFETEIFAPIMQHLEKLTGVAYQNAGDLRPAYCVLADHIRSTCLAIADGGMPSNEGRGYVIRKIIRRAALFAQKLGSINYFLAIAPVFIESMASIYPELLHHKHVIENVLAHEIEKFTHNLSHGQALLTTLFKEQKEKIITGPQAFKLYDTYGFPLELTLLIAHDNGFSVDHEGFEKEMEQQRLHSGKKVSYHAATSLDESIATTFIGYDDYIAETSISALIENNNPTEHIAAGTRCFVITEQSPFYVECGGQVSDQGWITLGGHTVPLLSLKKIGNAIAAEIVAPCAISINMSVKCVVDAALRFNTMKNHTATHLLQSTLLHIVGPHIKQAGSLVAPDYLRFDFNSHEPLSAEQIAMIEVGVNQMIRANIPVVIEETTLKDAQSRGVIAFFGEKYNPEKVRVVQVPDYSAELCGGTHVRATGDIGCFKITEVNALSAGSRRIVAITGPKAIDTYIESFATVKTLAQEFKVPSRELTLAIKKQQATLKTTQQQLNSLKKQLTTLLIPTWIAAAENIHGIPFGSITIDHLASEELRDAATATAKAEQGIYVFALKATPLNSFVVALSPTLSAKLSLPKLVAHLATQGVRAGGSATLIQGGTTIDVHILHALVKKWVSEQS